jgi:hypothetical protein
VIEVEGDADHDPVGEQPQPAEHEEQRAGDLVERARIALGAVLRDELDQAAAVAELQRREVHRQRAEEDPQAVLGGAEMRQVERQHDQPDRGLRRDRQVTGADVARDGGQLATGNVCPG